jgi:predicted metal-binding transcription factor (methanogenesis marker protein 9)
MGNMQDILHMDLEDFIRIKNELEREQKISSGEPILHDVLPNENKSMIQRAKELKHG